MSPTSPVYEEEPETPVMELAQSNGVDGSTSKSNGESLESTVALPDSHPSGGQPQSSGRKPPVLKGTRQAWCVGGNFGVGYVQKNGAYIDGTMDPYIYIYMRIVLNGPL